MASLRGHVMENPDLFKAKNIKPTNAILLWIVWLHDFLAQISVFLFCTESRIKSSFGGRGIWLACPLPPPHRHTLVSSLPRQLDIYYSHCSYNFNFIEEGTRLNRSQIITILSQLIFRNRWSIFSNYNSLFDSAMKHEYPNDSPAQICI